MTRSLVVSPIIIYVGLLYISAEWISEVLRAVSWNGTAKYLRLKGWKDVSLTTHNLNKVYQMESMKHQPETIQPQTKELNDPNHPSQPSE